MLPGIGDDTSIFLKSMGRWPRTDYAGDQLGKPLLNYQ